MKWKFNPYFVSIWVIVNVLNLTWWILYIIGSANPSPHSTGVIGIFPLRTLIILGFWSIPFNLFPAIWYIKGMRKYLKEVGQPSREKRTIDVNPWIVYPFWITLFVLPLVMFLAAYGTWVYSWNHTCTSYPLYAILSAPKIHDIGTSHPIARFYQTGKTHALFTYNLTGDPQSGSWGFGLESWNTDYSEILPEFQPTLHTLSYSSANGSLHGSCISLVQALNTTTPTACLEGTFTQTSALALNLATTSPTPTPQTSLRSTYDRWQFGFIAAPYVILRQFDDVLQRFDKIVLRTAVPNPQDCTQLKVCLAGPRSYGASMISPGVLAPLGVILRSQAQYASSCISFGQSN